MVRSSRPFSRLFRLLSAGIALCLCVGPETGPGQTIRDARKQILEAETIRDTGFDPSDFRSIFYQVTRNVIHEDPDNATQLVFKTAQLIRIDEKASEDNHFKRLSDGRSHMSSFLQYFEDRMESLDCIGMMIRTYRDDREGLIPFTGTVRYAPRFAFLGHFLSKGGNYDTKAALDLVRRDLRTVAGEGRYEFLAPYILDLAMLLRPAQRVALAEWAAEQKQSPDFTISSMGEAILLGLALFERSENLSIDAPGLLRGDLLDGRLVELLRDESVSPAWRAGFCTLVSSHFLQEMSPALRIETGRLMGKVLENDLPLQGVSFSYAIAAFLRGNANDEEWKSVGKNLLEAWETRTPKRSGGDISHLRPSKYWIVPMMELACRVGTIDQVKDHYEKYRNSTEPIHPGLWINLIKTRNFYLANLIHQKQSATTAFRSDHYHLDTTYDKTLESAIPEYLKTISNREDRALAELLLAAVVDPKVKKVDQADTTQQDRFTRFGEKYSTMPNWQSSKRVRAFEVLSLSHRNPVFTTWLKANQKGLENRIAQTEPRIRPYWAARMEMHSAMESLEEGLLFPSRMLWGRTVFEENKILQRRQNDLAEAAIDMLDGRVRLACEARDIDRLRNFLVFSRQVLETVPENVYHPDVHRFSIRVITAHAICNEMEAWNDWWDQLEGRRQRHLVTLLENSRHLIESLETLLNRESLDPAVAFESSITRRRILREILETEWVDRSCQGYSNLAKATAKRLLTENDLFEISQSIARKAPRKGSSWREYLGALSDQGQLSEALRAVEDELDGLEDEPTLINVLKVEKWHILRSLGQDEAAAAVRNDLVHQDLDLPREYKATVESFRKR